MGGGAQLCTSFRERRAKRSLPLPLESYSDFAAGDFLASAGAFRWASYCAARENRSAGRRGGWAFGPKTAVERDRALASRCALLPAGARICLLRELEFPRFARSPQGREARRFGADPRRSSIFRRGGGSPARRSAAAGQPPPIAPGGLVGVMAPKPRFADVAKNAGTRLPKCSRPD